MTQRDHRIPPSSLEQAEQPPAAPPTEAGMQPPFERLAMVRTRFRLSRRAWIIVAVIALLLTSYLADAIASVGRVRSGVVAGSLALGGKSETEARELLTARAELLAAEPVELFADTHRMSVTPSEIRFEPDVDSTLTAAMGVGRTGNLPVRTWHRVRGLFASTDVGWSSSYDREAAALLVADWAGRIDTQGHEAGIVAQGSTMVPVGAVPGRRLDRPGSVRAIITGLETWPRRSMELPITFESRRTTIEDAERAAAVANNWASSPVALVLPDGARLTLGTEQIASMLEAVPQRRGSDWTLQVRFSPERIDEELGERMRTYDAEPQDASFVVHGTSVSVSEGTEGRVFDAGGTATALGRAAGSESDRTAEVVFEAVQPALTTEQARALRITELVSTFTTNFPCCQPRVANIHKMADAVSGAIVRPGQTFSLNGHVGQRTSERGYVMAPMIFDGEYRDDVGGGVSQFATTMYNAIFFGGYKFETYKAHSYYISRYPPGREATISWPHPDLKFTNNSGAGILIRTSYDGTSVTVSFYGDKEGKSVSTETGERTNFTDPEQRRVANPDLPPGAERVVQRGAQGFDIVVWRIIRKDGNEERERFFTRYRAQPEIVEVSPHPVEEDGEDEEGEDPEERGRREPREPQQPGDEPEPTESPDEG